MLFTSWREMQVAALGPGNSCTKANWQKMLSENDTSASLRLRILREVLEESEESEDDDSEDSGAQEKSTRRRSRSYRAGGFYPKPRAGDPNAIVRMNQWRHGVLNASEWWALLEDDSTYTDGSHADQRFRDKFCVPRMVYEDMFDEIKNVCLPEGILPSGPKSLLSSGLYTFTPVLRTSTATSKSLHTLGSHSAEAS